MDHQVTDEKLFKQIKQGDERAFRRLFNRYYQVLLAIAINLIKDINGAKDTVQEVFFQIWKRRDVLEIPDKVEAYLKRSTINRALNLIQSKKRMVPLAPDFDASGKNAGAQEQLEAEEMNLVIQQALASLPERCRTVFVMKRIEGLSLKEIAERLDISPKTVENQITKALKVLKEAVKPYVEKEL